MHAYRSLKMLQLMKMYAMVMKMLHRKENNDVDTNESDLYRVPFTELPNSFNNAE